MKLVKVKISSNEAVEMELGQAIELEQDHHQAHIDLHMITPQLLIGTGHSEQAPASMSAQNLAWH